MVRYLIRWQREFEHFKGAISKWEKNVGDKCSPGDSIALIDTDKASVSFDAQDDFFIAKLLVEPGQEVGVGAPIMVTVDDESHVKAFADYVHESSKEQSKPPAPEPSKPSEDVKPPSPPPKKEETPKAEPPKSSPANEPPKPAEAQSKKPAPLASTSKPDSSASTMFAPNWGMAIKSSPLAGRLAVFQNEYVSKYGFTGHTPLELKSDKKEEKK